MKFITTIKNIFSIEELRDRIVNTLFYLFIFRLGSFVLLPGLDFDKVESSIPTGNSGNPLDFLNTLVGGAFHNKAIFSLGIMPYITASIVIQLLTVAVPYFQKLQKDGESGRNQINKYTKYLTILVCLVQSRAFLFTTKDLLMDGYSHSFFIISSMVILTSGSMFCLWLGDKITEKGIGNGVSLLIMIGIISRFLPSVRDDFASSGVLLIFIKSLLFFFIVVATVAITQAIRKVPVSYAKQMVNGRNMLGTGQRQYIPLKVIAAGVMPIIFAQSVMFLPSLLFGIGKDSNSVMSTLFYLYSDRFSVTYNVTFALLIILFTYFYTAITTNPNQIADDLKRNNGFVPGIKPGNSTADFFDKVMSRLLLPGSLIIALIAVLPVFANAFVLEGFASFFGGTSLLIVVGVVLDTLQQIESYLLMQRYEGMMKSGKVKGRQNYSVAG